MQTSSDRLHLRLLKRVYSHEGLLGFIGTIVYSVESPIFIQDDPFRRRWWSYVCVCVYSVFQWPLKVAFFFAFGNQWAELDQASPY